MDPSVSDSTESGQPLVTSSAVGFRDVTKNNETPTNQTGISKRPTGRSNTGNSSIGRTTTRTSMLTPPKPVGPPPTFLQSMKSIICASLSWVLNFTMKDQYACRFDSRRLLLAFATDELSMRVGQTLAGLLNATLIIALTKCELHIVQSSFLVLGMCFFVGGIRFSEQGFAAPYDLVYASYLFFQLYSHATLYTDEGIEPSTRYPKKDGKNDEEEEEKPQMSVVAVTAEWLVDSISGLTASGSSISQEFVSIILLPIVGNAAEHVTAVTVSYKDKLTLSLGVAVGSSIQIALFVIPFIVTLAWILRKPLTLLFDPYESITLFLAVLTMARSNWLEGMILMCLYLILCVTFWYYPDIMQCT
ncbi:hypothetical protein BT96DRAFT_914405 [Gymnopus androsaceus JB14]|uniref:Sodium/calcium exchanger membrane region domain-containing protein n=1 Tax=Gymnopus androsaceus JB14 TaxID=1447944 RepID=A0A6A4IF59_9AGAR|nr:hypothetical protein BT96DRAFT_914405 [Gymnopus androsaceus JB14]